MSIAVSTSISQILTSTVKVFHFFSGKDGRGWLDACLPKVLIILFTSYLDPNDYFQGYCRFDYMHFIHWIKKSLPWWSLYSSPPRQHLHGSWELLCLLLQVRASGDYVSMSPGLTVCNYPNFSHRSPDPWRNVLRSCQCDPAFLRILDTDAGVRDFALRVGDDSRDPNLQKQRLFIPEWKTACWNSHQGFSNVLHYVG